MGKEKNLRKLGPKSYRWIGAGLLAAVMKERAQLKGRTVAVPLNGGNIDLALFKSWVLN